MTPTPQTGHAVFRTRSSRLGAFTLIELLTVIAIIGVLAAIIIPVVGKVRSTAKRTLCVSRLSAVAQMSMLYTHDNKGVFVNNGTTTATRWPIQMINYFPNAKKIYDASPEPKAKNFFENPASGAFFKCPTQTVEDGAEGAQGVFGLNNNIGGNGTLPLRKVRASSVKAPSRLIVFGTTDGIGAADGGLSMNINGPAPRATAEGYVGTTQRLGLAPNFGPQAVIAFADGHVEVRPICNANAWPWNNPAEAFNP
jgi:prepilin-type N-terminal cleavage/methylation domain-containing protein/prepilin-type processing-associated H-X9-DG protein